MVSRKRDEPHTPEQHRLPQGSKKMKGYASPLPKTPLRNVMTPDKGTVVHSSSQRPAAELIGSDFKSASRSRLASTSIELLNHADSEESGRRPEELAARNRRNRKAELMSPVIHSSPKAAMPQAFSGSKLAARKGSTVSTGSGSTPVASVIAGEAANRPLPGSNGKAANKMTAEQMSRVFEDWIKIAADNKINAKNTWNLALIDYFSELSFVRDGASINFQKASCTLDGCVKIYSSRVDSVVDETGKLLNGLADGNFRQARGQEDEGDSNEAEDEEGESGQKKRPVRKASRHASTLEKNPEALCLKQFELEHAVDPLFRKTCAEFDESSSRGSLMHNLSLSASCQVVFDSADASRLGSEDPAKRMVSGGSVNLTLLRNSIGSTTLASVNDRRICAPFAEYSLADGRSARMAEEQMAKAMERLSKINIGPINSAPTGSGPAPMELDGQVFDAPNNSGPDDNDYGPLMDDDYGGTAEAMFSDAEPADDTEMAAITMEQQGFTRDNEGIDNMFSYFDDSVKQQSWAGPNHWKVRRPTFIRQANADPAKKPGTRQRKDFSLDFDDHAAEVDVEALFAKPANASTITLTKTQIEERALKDNLLPEDLHFSSVNFLRLFTKPAWRFGTSQTVTRQVMRPRAAEQIDFAQDRPEIEGDFWAQNAHPEGVADVNHGILWELHDYLLIFLF